MNDDEASRKNLDTTTNGSEKAKRPAADAHVSDIATKRRRPNDDRRWCIVRLSRDVVEGETIVVQWKDENEPPFRFVTTSPYEAGTELLVVAPGGRSPDLPKIAGRGKRRSAFDRAAIESEFFSTLWPFLESKGWTRRLGDFLPPEGPPMRTTEQVADSASKSTDPKFQEVYQTFRSNSQRLIQRHKTEQKNNRKNDTGKRGTRNSLKGFEWKYCRKLYPKKESRVGKEHQATNLPKAGCHTVESNNDEERGYVRVWDPDLYNVQDVDVVLERSNSAEDEWTDDAKVAFRESLLSRRKNFTSVARDMERSIGSCLRHYYGTFKSTDEYKNCKMAFRDNDDGSAPDPNSDYCHICGGTGRLLCCETCRNSAHMKCVHMTRVPVGNWYCDECRSKTKQDTNVDEGANNSNNSNNNINVTKN